MRIYEYLYGFSHFCHHELVCMGTDVIDWGEQASDASREADQWVTGPWLGTEWGSVASGEADQWASGPLLGTEWPLVASV